MFGFGLEFWLRPLATSIMMNYFWTIYHSLQKHVLFLLYLLCILFFYINCTLKHQSPFQLFSRETVGFSESCKAVILFYYLMKYQANRQTKTKFILIVHNNLPGIKSEFLQNYSHYFLCPNVYSLAIEFILILDISWIESNIYIWKKHKDISMTLFHWSLILILKDPTDNHNDALV